MSLDEQGFIDLVKRAEDDAAEDIGRYKWRLGLFALLGYAVIFGVLLMLLALIGGTAGLIAFGGAGVAILLLKKKLIFVILGAIWVFLKALWVRFEKPQGYRLKRQEYPQLFQEIDDLTRSLDALKIHEVILNDDLNAAVVQHPRFGVIGGQRNILMLGVQLLLALSPEQMRSVLAHEFGHLSGNHSRFAGWIYRIRLTWQRIMMAFDESSSFGAGMMRRFFDWYAPKFSAYSFALARNNEYEADAVAAELTSPSIAASALLNVHVRAPHIDEDYWDAFFKAVDLQPQPPQKPYAGLATFLKQSLLSDADFAERMQKELDVETHYANTHPALKDRLAALNITPCPPDAFSENAAEVWLGDRYDAILEKFDAEWLERMAEPWQERYEYVQESHAFLAKMQGRAADAITDEDLWKYAMLTREFAENSEALPLFEEVIRREPDAYGAYFYASEILLEQDDERGLEYLRKTFDSPNLIEQAAHIGANYWHEKGEEAKAEQWWDDAVARNEQHQVVLAERATVSEDDTYLAPEGVDPQLLEKLKTELSAAKMAGKAWLAFKQVEHYPENPVWVVAFHPKGFRFDDEDLPQKLIQQLQLDMGDVDLFFVATRGDTKSIAKKVKKAGERIV